MKAYLLLTFLCASLIGCASTTKKLSDPYDWSFDRVQSSHPELMPLRQKWYDSLDHAASEASGLDLDTQTKIAFVEQQTQSQYKDWRAAAGRAVFQTPGIDEAYWVPFFRKLDSSGVPHDMSQAAIIKAARAKAQASHTPAH